MLKTGGSTSSVPVTADSTLVLGPTYDSVPCTCLVFAFALLLATLGPLGGTFLQTRAVFRRQVSVPSVFVTVPRVAGPLYVMGDDPVPGLDVAALSNVVTALSGGISPIRLRRMDATSAAGSSRSRARGARFESVTDRG